MRCARRPWLTGPANSARSAAKEGGGTRRARRTRTSRSKAWPRRSERVCSPAPALTHGTNDATFSSALVNALYAAAPGAPSTGRGQRRRLYRCARHRHLSSAAADGQSAGPAVRAEISQGIGSDVTASFAYAARDRQGVKINSSWSTAYSAAKDRDLTMAILPDFAAFARGYDKGGPGALCAARRRSRDAGVGLSETRRGPRERVPARKRARRRNARPLFHHRPQARSDLALPQRQSRDQPGRPQRRDAFAPDALADKPLAILARADRRDAHGRCRAVCRRWRSACSAISVTTWCG